MKSHSFLYLCFQTVSSFVINKSIINKNTMRCKYKPSKVIEEILRQSSNKIGSEWTYKDFVDNINNIDSATILDEQKGLFIVDNNNGENIDFNNIHLLKIIPEMNNIIIDKLTGNGINFDIYQNPTNIFSNIPVAFQFIGVYIIISLLFTFIRNSQVSGNMPGNLLNQLLQKPETTDISKLNVTFNDVAGCDEAKEELVEVVDFLKNPDRYIIAGAKIPRGILLEGEPGTGKTLLAQAVAGEANVNFISASGSEFIEMFVGVGASRVRNLFNAAKENSPCVIFIDEIDAVGRQRGAGVNTGNDEREQTLNQILTNMDGFEKTDGIIVLAATNRVDILDSALTRPGRFDRKINVPLPDLIGRKAISKVHFRNKNVSNNLSFDDIAILTGGFSGADIANLANEAAILSVRKNATQISPKTVIDAYEKITIGLPNKEETREDDILRLIAYHETGHTLMALLFKEFFNVKRVTINGNKAGAGGYTLSTPLSRYQSFPTKKFLLANIIVTLGGRAAEVILYNKYPNTKALNYDDNYVFDDINNLDITTGASADLQRADSIARQYISQFGLDDMIGLYDNSIGTKPFLGREMAMGTNKLSEATKQIIDSRVNKLVEFSYKKACQIIKNNQEVFDEIAMELLKEKTLSGKQLEKYNVTMKKSSTVLSRPIGGTHLPP
tara:strand:+ start:2409 stop:4418 length:2010 start_codon:yes stop_codon:yes gene_type:complete